jgi:hypothetical protein
VAKKTAEELATLQSQLGIADADFGVFVEEEKAYLQGLVEEPPDVTLRFLYVEALDDLAACQ